MKIKKLSILIPVYNEAETIPVILKKISEVKLTGGIKKEIIIINDGSTDNSEDVTNECINSHVDDEIKLYNQKLNQGKGAAIQKGIEIATGDFIIIQDADIEYDPNEYNKMLKPVINGFADVVYGSRFMGGSSHRILFFWHSIGNKFLTFLSNLFSNLNLTDMETCYKLFRSDILKKILLKEKRWV